MKGDYKMKSSKKITKLLSLLLVGAMLIAMLAACGTGPADTGQDGPGPGPGTATAPPTGSDTAPVSARDTLAIQATSDPGSLSPLAGAIGFVPTQLFAEPLFDFDLDNNIVPRLAREVEKIADDHLIIHLRQGLTFPSGYRFTAEDVLFTLQLYYEEPTRHGFVRIIDMERTRAIDEYTVEIFQHDASVAQFPSRYTIINIMSKHAYDPIEIVTNPNPMVIGPYRVVEYVQGSHVRLEANPYYYGDQPLIPNLIFYVIDEPAQITNALEGGLIHIGTATPHDANFLQDIGFNIARGPDTRSHSAIFNVTTLNYYERIAISYAINSPAIVDIVWNGWADVTDFPGARGKLDYVPEWGGRHDIYVDLFNLEKALYYAEKGGLVGRTLTIITDGSDAYDAYAQIMQEDLRQIGVYTEIIRHDRATFAQLLASPDAVGYDIGFALTFVMSGLASFMIAEWGIINNSGWFDEDFDYFWAWGRTLNSTMDWDTRQAMMPDFIDFFLSVNPWYAIVAIPVMWAVDPALGGVRTGGAGNTILFQYVYWTE